MKRYIVFISVVLVVLLSLVLVVTPALADGGTATANVTVSEITVGEYQEGLGVSVNGTVTITAISDVKGKSSEAYASSNGSVSIASDNGDTIIHEDDNPIEVYDPVSAKNSASADASQVYTWSFVLTDAGIYVVSHSGTAYVWYDKNGLGTGDENVATDSDTAEITVVIPNTGGSGGNSDNGTDSTGSGDTGTSDNGTDNTGSGDTGTGDVGTSGDTGDEAEAGVDEGILYLMTLEESGQFYLVVRFGWDASDYRYDSVIDDWSNQITDSIMASGLYDGTRYMFEIPEDTIISRHDGSHVTGIFLSDLVGDTVTSTYSEMVFSNPVTVYRCEGDWYRNVDGYWVGGTLIEIGTFTEIVDFTATLENS